MFEMPVGMVIAFTGTRVAARDLASHGWLICDGSLVSRVTYKALFEVLGSSAGSPTEDGFRLPNLQGVFLRGIDATDPRSPANIDRYAEYPGGNTSGSADMVCSRQGHQLAGHTHTYAHYVPDRNFLITDGGEKWHPPVNLTNQQTYLTGGQETRPENVYVHYLIYAGLMNS